VNSRNAQLTVTHQGCIRNTLQVECDAKVSVVRGSG